jgi:hypothetical protein
MDSLLPGILPSLFSVMLDARMPAYLLVYPGAQGCLILLGEEQLSSQGRRLVDIGIQESAKQERSIRNVVHTFAADVESQTEIPLFPRKFPIVLRVHKRS